MHLLNSSPVPPASIPIQFVTEDCHLSEFLTKKNKFNLHFLTAARKLKKKENKHQHDSKKFKRKMRLSLITKIYWNQKCRPGRQVKRIGEGGGFGEWAQGVRIGFAASAANGPGLGFYLLTLDQTAKRPKW